MSKQPIFTFIGRYYPRRALSSACMHLSTIKGKPVISFSAPQADSSFSHFPYTLRSDLTPSSPTASSSTSSGPTQHAPLTCLAWAPNCGRNYHLLATGARDGTIRIWRVEPPGERGRVDYDMPGEVVKEWRGQCTGEFGKGGARVGTVDVRFFFSHFVFIIH